MEGTLPGKPLTLSSWPESLGRSHLQLVVAQKVPDISAKFLAEAEAARPTAEYILALHEATQQLQHERCADMPSWQDAVQGVEAPYPDNPDAGEWKRGWQFHACSAREHHFLEHVLKLAPSRPR